MIGEVETMCTGDSDSKESACNVGELGSIPGLGRSLGRGHGNPLQFSCLEKPYGQRSLTGYSPQHCKESDTTEQLSTTQHCWWGCKVLKLLWKTVQKFLKKLKIGLPMI